MAGRRETAGFEPLELLADGRFDDRGEVAVRDLRAHEGPEPLELLVERGAGGELHLVPPGGEGLDDGRRHRGRRFGGHRDRSQAIRTFSELRRA